MDAAIQPLCIGVRPHRRDDHDGHNSASTGRSLVGFSKRALVRFQIFAFDTCVQAGATWVSACIRWMNNSLSTGAAILDW